MSWVLSVLYGAVRAWNFIEFELFRNVKNVVSEGEFAVVLAPAEGSFNKQDKILKEENHKLVISFNL